MKVKNINMLNIDDLFNILVRKDKDENHHLKPFGMNIDKILNHMEISLELEEVTLFEYIYLKMFVNRISLFERSTMNSELDIKKIKKTYEEIPESSIDSFITFLSSTKDSKYDITDWLSPQGFIFGSCTVSLTGQNLMQIITFEPKSFFMNATSLCMNHTEEIDPKPIQGSLNENYNELIYEDEDLKNSIISSFISNFYKFMNSKCLLIDLPSDYFSADMVSSTELNRPILYSVRNSKIEINYRDDEFDITKSKLDDYLEYIKSRNLTKREIMKDTIIETNFYVDFSVFCQFIKYFPMSSITSVDSLLLLLNKNSEGQIEINCPDFLKDFEKRLNANLFNFNNKIKNSYPDSNGIIKLFELTRGYNKIHFSLSLSLYDINESVTDIYSYIYLESKNYVEYLFLDIIKKYMNSVNAVYSYITQNVKR